VLDRLEAYSWSRYKGNAASKAEEFVTYDVLTE